MNPQQVIDLQKILVARGYMTQAEMNTGPGIYGPKTTAAMNKAVADAVKTSAAANPTTQALVKTNSAEGLVNAYLTGDWSGVTDISGTPFSPAQQQEALSKATADLAPYYEAQKQYETQTAEELLTQKQADYQAYLDTQANKFQEEKTTQDQAAANQGVLFSGGRVQKLQNLQDVYAKEQAYKQGTAGRDIASTARDYQYKYGNESANTLSKYYNLGGNVYNPNVATGGVTPTGLSSIYNPSGSTFQGTRINEAKAESQKRAAGLLWNRGNKIVQGGYKNLF
ncbi:MAG: hypothetical protein NTV06_06315 [candidate division Zixibacteria bacterium]|nr:hypothetical protein [candidate division Zixibacteria bacterium]